MDSNSQVLFLHGGPGLTAEMERRRYGNRLPVYWWDQPQVPFGSINPLEVLVNAAETQVRNLTELHGAPVALLASSFGARVAEELLRRAPDRILATTICGGVLNLKRAFVQLGRHLARSRSDIALAEASERAADSDNAEHVWALIAAITSIPGFVDAYWTDAGAVSRATMRELAAGGTLFHMQTFQVMLNSELSRAPGSHSDVILADRVRILIGRSDPLVDEAEAGLWRAIFPQATISLVEGGHFPHLELPPEKWLPV